MKKIPLIFCLALTACGGGSSAPTQTPTQPQVQIDPNMTVPFKTALINSAKNGYVGSFTVSGWVDNSTLSNPQPRATVTGTGTLNMAVGAMATFNSGPFIGKSVYKQVATTNLTLTSGTSTQSSTGTANSYIDSVFGSTRAVESSGATYWYADYLLPDTVKAGSTGSLGASADTNNVVTTKETYSAATDSATSLLVTITKDTFTAPIGKTGQTISVYKIDTQGNLSIKSIESNAYYQSTQIKNLVFTFK